MLNIIWFLLIAISVVVGAINGRMDAVTRSIAEYSKTAVELAIGLVGMMALWMGMMKIAEASGLVRFISLLARPLVRLLFPKIPDGHPAASSILMNLAANALGLGNAATPLGLKAMQDLQGLNERKDVATNEMATFLVLNTASVQLLPVLVISIRIGLGSAEPASIVGPTLMSTLVSALFAVVIVKIFERFGHEHSAGECKGGESA